MEATYARQLIKAGLPRANAKRLIAQFMESQGWELVLFQCNPPLDSETSSYYLRFNPWTNLLLEYGVNVTHGESKWETMVKKQVLDGLSKIFLSHTVLVSRPVRSQDWHISMEVHLSTRADAVNTTWPPHANGGDYLPLAGYLL